MELGEKITPQMLEAIAEHNNRLSMAAQSAKTRLQSVPKNMRDDAIERNISYWSNVISALRWSTGVARQRTIKVENNGIATV